MDEIRTGIDFVNTCGFLKLVEACNEVINCHCVFWGFSDDGSGFSFDLDDVSEVRLGLEVVGLRLELEVGFDEWRLGSLR